MGLLDIFSHNYPYTDFHELNLDWVIKRIIELDENLKNFINLNTIKYANPILWDITRQYEANTVVVDGATGNAYISVKAVPSGVQINRSEYWTQIYNYQNALNVLREQIAFNEGDTTTATRAHEVDSLVFVKELLYRVISPMIAGDSFIVGSNIEKVDIELLLKQERSARQQADTQLQSDIDNEVSARQQADTQLQSNIDNEVSARQQADTQLQSNIDNESSTRLSVDNALGRRITDEVATRTPNLQNREFLICGDSYNDEAGEWGSLVKSKLGIATDKWHDVSQGGAGFVGNGVILFINQITGYTGNRDAITDIIVCGGANDSFSSEVSDSWWSRVKDNMTSFNNYVKENYPNATVYLGFIAGSLDWGEGGVVAGRTYPCRQLCKYFYYGNALNMGWKILHNTDLALSTNIINISSDKLHPSNFGSEEIAKAIVDAYLTGYADITYPKTNACNTEPILGNTQIQYEVHNEITTFHITSDFYVAYTDGTTINNASIIAYFNNVGFNESFECPGIARLDDFDNLSIQYIPCRFLFTRNVLYIDLQSTNTTHSVTSGHTGYLRLTPIDIQIPTRLIP